MNITRIYPRDEKTWDLIQAAFAEADRIMAERGWDVGHVDQEYVRRTIERLWTDGMDREALKTKARAAVSIEVDALFNALGDAEQKAYNEERASGLVEALIPGVEEARHLGVDAYRESLTKSGDAGAAGLAWACIAATSKNKPLIRALAEIGLGGFHPWHCEYRVDCHALLPADVERVQSISVQEAGLRSFSARLNSMGFVTTVETQVD